MANLERNGSRKIRGQLFKQRIPKLGYYFIVTDTKETEQNYMFGLRNSIPPELQGKLVIKVDVEHGFFRTQLPIAHIFQNAGPISRSEARRLAAMISRFQDVVLDFSGVKTIGQAFTHELFVVFRRDNPDIKFACENMEEPVKNMIDRVLHTK